MEEKLTAKVRWGVNYKLDKLDSSILKTQFFLTAKIVVSVMRLVCVAVGL